MASTAKSGVPFGDPKKTAGFDFAFLLSAIFLICLGLLSLYSVGAAQEGSKFFQKQFLNAFLGLVPLSIFFFVPPKMWRKGATLMYILNLLLLSAVLLAGKTVKGAERWIDIGPLQFQPSEAAKLLIVLTLASFYASREDKINKLSTFLLGMLHVAIPCLLILKQPHLGAALVLLSIWLAISLVAGVPTKFILTIVAAIVGFGAALVISAVALPELKLAHGYQIDRIQGLIMRNDKDQMYQAQQAEFAFAEGGLNGSGFLRGEQKRAKYIPEQENDFIFTVIGEEFGFMGCTILLAAYGFFFYRIFLAMLYATETYHRLLASGVFTLLAFHTIVNLGMVLQLLPVVGLWLPFLSMGGTALWLCMACVGLMLRLRMNERTQY